MQSIETVREQIGARTERLRQVAAELKTELFGIDDVIDRVIDTVRAWYVLPEIITRPVIVNLWGLTGTGKTQLTRNLAKKLGFYDRLIEVQMDGFSNGGGNTISTMLSDSGIVQGTPGILVLDEFQRFRTVNHDGSDRKVERYMDVWTLLSDGKLPPSFSFLGELEMKLAEAAYRDESKGNPAEDGDEDDEIPHLFSSRAPKAGSRFSLSPYQARDFKDTLKLKASVVEIMTWSPKELHQRLIAFKNDPQVWETDYSKLLIFVSGNLDEMYVNMASRVEDCDTDADVFHAMSSTLSVIDVKRALSSRFKPEQIARLGNNHVIYPSLSRAAYEKLIEVAVEQYLQEVERSSGLRFKVTQAVKAQIYANSVFPTQGTRPVFSSVHRLLSAPLVNFTLWALESGAKPDQELCIDLVADVDAKRLVARWGDLTNQMDVSFEINQLRQRTDHNLRTVLAVHEAGHGLVYTLLFGQPPLEIRINMATFAGGYNSFNTLQVQSRRNLLDDICAALAGRAAEEMVFGAVALTSGSESDLKHATAKMASFIRHSGFGKRISHVDVSIQAEEGINTDVAGSNADIETGLVAQYQRAREILEDNKAAFLNIVGALMEKGELTAHEISKRLGFEEGKTRRDVLENYEEMYAAFVNRHAANGEKIQRRA